MKRRKVGNLLALAVLSYLTERPMHPYELGRTLRANNDARSIPYRPSSLYMVFEQLAKAGFVQAQETTRQGQRPERTVYALTEQGRQELHDWLRELVSEPQHEYPHFVAALSLIAALPPDEVVDLLQRRIANLDRQRHEIRQMMDETLAAGVPPLFLVEEDYRLALLDAERAFAQQFIERITDPAAGWGPAWAAFHTDTETSTHTPAQRDPGQGRA